MIWLLTLLPALGGLALWALAGRLPAQKGREAMARAVIGGAAVLICLATLGVALALALAPDGAQGQFDWAPGLPLLARLTPGAAMIAVLTPLVGACVLAFASMHQKAHGLARLTGLLLVFMGAMELVVMAGDLVTLLIGWEIMGACSWALIGHEWRKRGAMGSAGYAFVMTRGGDLGLYAALIATFAATGRADYAALGELDGAAQAIAGFGLLLAAASKAGQLPFSPWLMRAMAGPTSVSALLHSSTMVAAGAFLMARLHVYLAPVPGLGATLVAVGLATALAGGVVAVVQLHAKKVLAASTSAQLGLMFAAVGAGYPGVALLHLVIHALFKTPLFFAAGMAHEVAESYDMRRMGVGRALPWVPWLSLPAALALAGTPPLGGGWTKEEIIATLAHLSPWLEAAGLLAGGLSAAYATRFFVMVLGPRAAQGRGASHRVEKTALAVLATLSLLASLLWVPRIEEAVVGFLGAAPPETTVAELLTSILVLGLGVVAGLALSHDPAPHPAADWFGLPWLIERGIEAPTQRLAIRAARVDDAWIDALPDGAGLLGPGVGRGLGRADARLLDGMSRRGRGAFVGMVGGAVWLAQALARHSAREGERLSDLIPSGTARGAGLAASGARRLQTGYSHHYYVIIATGFVLGLLILLAGA